MTWAVFDIHSPALQIDDAGCRRIGEGPAIKMPPALFTGQTMADAEEERQARLKQFIMRQNGR